ncbi:retinol dehydrogenase [Chromobacterium phragmitis]|uniref:Retinol dehydrogenase n=2 Tax=Chromobacterium phragmitis TaxID=2202141 RepID=A0A344UNK2_9NEIS|nr:retinol dehydrogenase [Chromobacterium phragmitis]
MQTKSVLVTGASSGLGAAAASLLAKRGYHVYAAVRRLGTGPAGTCEIELDVTKPETIEHAQSQITRAEDGRPLWALVNNAGICVPAPLEILNADELRRQLEVNLIGQFTVTQAFLPQLRQSRGRIINVTSGLGSIAVPFLGAYSMAQFAKMAFSDILRRELMHSGVLVSVVQPGAIYTPIWDKFHAAADLATAKDHRDKVHPYASRFQAFLEQNESNARASPTRPDDFAKAILDTLESKEPAAHIPVGLDAEQFIEMARSHSPHSIDQLFASGMPSSTDFASHGGNA